MEELNFLFRWGHLLFGIAWIGMLYYFNFVQGGYFKAASSEGLADAKEKLAPSALWWFRWGAMFTFLTGVYLLSVLGASVHVNSYIIIGALLGTFMFLNVWVIIWPAQQIALGLNGKTGDGAAAGAKALLASRTNTLFSGPMAYFMLASQHGMSNGRLIDTGTWVAIALVVLLELNAIFGKQSVMASVKGVIYSSIALTFVLIFLLRLL